MKNPGARPGFLSAFMDSLSQVCLQRVAITCLLKTLDRTFLDLADTLLGQIILLADLLDGYTILAVEAKIRVHDLRFAGTQRLQYAADFRAQRILHDVVVRLITTFQQITHRYVFSLVYRGIQRAVTGIALENVVDLRLTHFQQLSQLFRTRLTLMFLLESHVGLVSLVVSANFVLRQAD